ncbi:MAG TPA: carboxypeptidase-like regulatory domain-containing protein, partial [Roseiflexaceae bacterium]|nr:carboxypeptidase-like regulatory domain-containing protein [Roseiflexaceae bacterium]
MSAFRHLPQALFALLVLLLSVSPMRAQPLPAALTGRVVSQLTGQPVPYASVGLARTRTGTTCDEAGAFTLPLPPGAATDSVQVSSVGYRRAARALTGL